VPHARVQKSWRRANLATRVRWPPPPGCGCASDSHSSPTHACFAGEYGGVGAFVKGKEWVPGGCSTYLHVDTPADEANTIINMTKVRGGSPPPLSI
jgi:hypothetical protein